MSFLLTLPIIAFIYHRNHRLSFTSAFTAYVAVLYALGLLAFTMYPMPDDAAQYCATHHLAPQLNIFEFIQDTQTGLYGVLQLAMNVVLFMPLGFMLCRWAGWKFWVATPFALGCSVFIETSQLTGIWGIYPCAYRQFDVDDMLTNTLGAMLGYGIAVLYTKLVPKKAKQLKGTNTSPGFVHRFVSMTIDFLLIDLVYVPLSLLYVTLFYLIFKPTGDGHFVWLSLTLEPRVLDYLTWITAGIAFLIFEMWIPYRHDGQTLGCRYTHMTIETKTRNRMQRLAFYAIRTLLLGAVFVCFVMNRGPWGWILLALLIFWIVKKCMPWDLVPGTASSTPRTFSYGVAGLPDTGSAAGGANAAAPVAQQTVPAAPAGAANASASMPTVAIPTSAQAQNIQQSISQQASQPNTPNASK